MGGTLHPVFRPPVPGAHPLDDVRALFLHLSEADALARELGVTPLGRFLRESSEGEIERWHSIDDGLRTIRALAAAVRERTTESIRWAHNIDHEFSSLEDCLALGAGHATEFCLVIT